MAAEHAEVCDPPPSAGHRLRFRTQGVQFIEIDHPSTQNDKRARLQASGIDTSDISFIPLDLTCDPIKDALGDAIDPDNPAVFVCEGVVPYLPYERVRALLAGIAATPVKAATLYLDAPVRPDHPMGRLLLSQLRLSTAIIGEPIHTILTSQEMDSLLGQTGWREQARTTGHDLQMPRLVADSRYLLLTRKHAT